MQTAPASNITSLLLAVLLTFISTASAASDVVPVASSLRDRGLSDSYAYGLIADLTTTFGAGPAGSSAARAAAVWGEATLRSAGFANVHRETFPIKKVTYSDLSLDVTGAHPQALVAIPLEGSAGASAIEGDVTTFATYQDFLDAPQQQVRGRIVFIAEKVQRTADGSGYVKAIRMREEGPRQAFTRGAAAYLVRSLGTHADRIASNGSTAWHLDGGIPAAAVSPADAQQLVRLSAKGRVAVRMSVKAIEQEATAENLVGEIPGTEPNLAPVVIGAHLDSWEQGTGAIDDGFGLATVTGAARLITELPQKPRRTIQLVWFGAEEISQPAPVMNFPAARAYLAQHPEDVRPDAIASESDWGGGKVLSLALPHNTAQSVRADVGQVLAQIGIPVVADEPTSGGPDVNVLRAAGMPVLQLRQDASLFFDVHHTANDTLDRIDPSNLKQNVAAWAAVIWILANRD